MTIIESHIHIPYYYKLTDQQFWYSPMSGCHTEYNFSGASPQLPIIVDFYRELSTLRVCNIHWDCISNVMYSCMVNRSLGKTNINPCHVIMSMGTKNAFTMWKCPFQPKANIIYLVKTSTDSNSDHVWCVKGLQIEWRQQHSLSSKFDIVEMVRGKLMATCMYLLTHSEGTSLL